MTIPVLLSVTVSSCKSPETRSLASHPIHAITANFSKNNQSKQQPPQKKKKKSTSKIYLTYYIATDLKEIDSLCTLEHSDGICYYCTVTFCYVSREALHS